jgi:hypothetical protein
VHWYYNRQGRPISNEQWTTEFSRTNRRVAWTDLGSLGRVSTVFLGLNHAYDDGPPIIFETMIFDGPMADYMERYSTEDQALAGHAFAVQALQFYQPEKRPALIHNGRKPRR